MNYIHRAGRSRSSYGDTVTPLQETPQPTATVTPLPSASPVGTQPQTTNTVAPSPSPRR